MMQEGYDKYKGGLFKIPLMDRWMVIATGSQLIDEMRKVADDELSLQEAVDDILQVEYTFGLEAQRNPYHIPVIRTQLTRNMPALFADMQDEIVHACNDIIPLDGNEWVNVPAYSSMLNITCRTSNRLIVGLPLCRSQEFADLHVKFAVQVIVCASIVNLLPNFIKPFFGRLLTNTPNSIERCTEYIRPIVDDRLRDIEEHGEEWADKPNDMITWLLDEAREERNARAVALRVLVLNFASLHSSSSSFTHALLHLAARPHLLQPLREEAEAVVQEEGWTKAAMDKLKKIDSFLKESQRVSALSLVSMNRKALKPFTFSNGTVIPAGTHVAVASASTHLDEANYANASEFDPFRFADMREKCGEETKHQLVSTDVGYVTFGYGKHACPGRFFASNMLKAIMAHLVLTYDIKLKDEGVRPADQWFGMNCTPNRKAEIMMRKRQS
ncbi:hypothetical protein SERLA73DRAFT_182766 [Serpula lacrymans var. lacrymans S7.3]|uniref:Cytochrome P450 n=2 Tax=Serpula lacrymans var. lacrymans TaxID=341189 RepID=F8Q0Y0_SERL3|nr:hypothetical protein SERLA73DRAFT_182766 [Serpula lacrymans var. lacrymans S7.3]